MSSRHTGTSQLVVRSSSKDGKKISVEKYYRGTVYLEFIKAIIRSAFAAIQYVTKAKAF